MSTVPGAKNRPTIIGSSAPEFAEDLEDVSLYAAEYGNYRITTSDQRTSIPSAQLWPGLIVYEADTGFLFVRSATSWLRAFTVMGKNRWTAKRSSASSSDTFASGTFASLVQLTIPAAEAYPGNYDIGANWVIKGNADLIASNLRIQAGGLVLNDDSAYDVGLARQQSAYSYPYVHAGGDLIVTLLFQLSTGVGTVYKAGTNIWATYVGP